MVRIDFDFEKMGRKYIYLLLFLPVMCICMMIFISIYFVYTVEDGKNNCMLEYVEYLKQGGNKGYFYRNGDIYHIDSQYIHNYGELIGKANGCLIISEKEIYLSIFNTVYCNTAYILR